MPVGDQVGLQDPTCDYCQEFAGSSSVYELRQHLASRSRLITVEDWVVFPTVSPLSRKHLLIAPFRHVRSIRQCSELELRTLRKVVTAASRDIIEPGEVFVSFEHGVGQTSSNGCGVVHAHMHLVVLPSSTLARVRDALRSRLKLLSTGPHWQVLSAISSGSAYITFGSTGDVDLFDGTDAPSQLTRRLIGESLGISWNWRDFSHWDWFDQTMNRLPDLTHVA